MHEAHVESAATTSGKNHVHYFCHQLGLNYNEINVHFIFLGGQNFEISKVEEDRQIMKIIQQRQHRWKLDIF